MNHLFPIPGVFVPTGAKSKGLSICLNIIPLALLWSTAQAGEFFNNFNSGLPPNAKVYGNARVVGSGGVDESGMLQLTTATRNQMGTFIIDPLDGNAAVTGFTARFKALVGGGAWNGADGFGFMFGKDLPNEPFPEVGRGMGLIVTFDTFNNGVGEITPGVRVLFKNKIIHNEFFPDMQLNRFVDTLIQFENGLLHVTYDNRTAVKNLEVGAKSLSGRFAFSARTGGSVDNHFIDDLKITTQASYSFLKSYGPVGDNVAPDSTIELVFREFEKNVSDSSIRLSVNGKDVTPQILLNDTGAKVVRYEPPSLLKPGSAHAVHLSFVNRANPSVTTEASYSFVVSSQVMLSR